MSETHGRASARVAPLRLTECIGRGNDRVCWRHPDNPAWCIKVSKPEHERPQNAIDFDYARRLADRGVHSPHLPEVHGWVQTDRGRGLVVDLVSDADGQPAPTLLTALRSGRASLAQAHQAIDEAFDWLIAQRVVLADFGIDNFLLRRTAAGEFCLVFVDGLGARHFGLHYLINRTLPWRAARRARRFRRKLLGMLREETEAH